MAKIVAEVGMQTDPAVEAEAKARADAARQKTTKPKNFSLEVIAGFVQLSQGAFNDLQLPEIDKRKLRSDGQYRSRFMQEYDRVIRQRGAVYGKLDFVDEPNVEKSPSYISGTRIVIGKTPQDWIKAFVESSTKKGSTKRATITHEKVVFSGTESKSTQVAEYRVIDALTENHMQLFVTSKRVVRAKHNNHIPVAVIPYNGNHILRSNIAWLDQDVTSYRRDPSILSRVLGNRTRFVLGGAFHPDHKGMGFMSSKGHEVYLPTVEIVVK